MRLLVGLVLSLLGVVLFSLGALTSVDPDPSLAASGQRRGTFFFFGLLFALFGLLVVLASNFNRNDK